MVYFDEPGQAELVHGVDVLQLHDAEEEDSPQIGIRELIDGL